VHITCTPLPAHFLFSLVSNKLDDSK
jgi:hypothetical protein